MKPLALTSHQEKNYLRRNGLWIGTGGDIPFPTALFTHRKKGQQGTSYFFGIACKNQAVTLRPGAAPFPLPNLRAGSHPHPANREFPPYFLPALPSDLRTGAGLFPIGSLASFSRLPCFSRYTEYMADLQIRLPGPNASSGGPTPDVVRSIDNSPPDYQCSSAEITTWKPLLKRVPVKAFRAAPL